MKQEIGEEKTPELVDIITPSPGTKRTYNAYLAMVPEMTDAQKAILWDRMVQARKTPWPRGATDRSSRSSRSTRCATNPRSTISGTVISSGTRRGPKASVSIANSNSHSPIHFSPMWNLPAFHLHKGNIVNRSIRIAIVIICILSSSYSNKLSAQGYPRLSSEQAASAHAMQASADRKSDEAFQSAPVIEAWAKKGKSYLPSAESPEQLPQAKIPAFPALRRWNVQLRRERRSGACGYEPQRRRPWEFPRSVRNRRPTHRDLQCRRHYPPQGPHSHSPPYITIAGNTAPGDGVCIAGNTVEWKRTMSLFDIAFGGATDVRERNDSLGGNPIGNIMIDHVSTS